MIAQTAEDRVIRGRVRAFPNIFSMANGGAKGAESRSEPRIRHRSAGREFGDDGGMLIK